MTSDTGGATEALPSAGVASPAPSAGRQLLGRGSIYTLGTALQLLAAALAIPAATRLLGSGEFGTVTLAVTAQTLLIPIANLGLPLAILRFYFDREEGVDHKLVAKGLAMSVPILAFGVVGVVFLTGLAWAPALIPSDPAAILVGVGLTLPATAVGAAMALLRAEERPLAYVSVALASSIGAQVLGIAALIVHPTPLSYLAGFAVALVAAGLAGLRLAGALGTRPAPLPDLDRALRYGLPTVPSTASIFVLAMGDRVIIQLIDGSSAVGKYQIGYAAGSVGMALVTALQNAWLPITFGAGDESRWGSLADSAATVTRLTAFTAGFLALVADSALRLLVPGSYDPRLLAEVAGIVALTTLPVATYVAHSQVLLWTKHTRSLALITPVAAACNLALVAALLSPFGLQGAAAATVIAVALQALLTSIAARRIGAEVPWQWRRDLDSYVLGSIAVALALIVPDTTWADVIRLAGAAVCGAAFVWTVARELRPGPV